VQELAGEVYQTGPQQTSRANTNVDPEFRSFSLSITSPLLHNHTPTMLNNTSTVPPVPHPKWATLSRVTLSSTASGSSFPGPPESVAAANHRLKQYLQDSPGNPMLSPHVPPSQAIPSSRRDVSTPTQRLTRPPSPIQRSKIVATRQNCRLDPSSPDAIEIHYQRFLWKSKAIYNPARRYRRKSNDTISPVIFHPPRYAQAELEEAMLAGAWTYKPVRPVVRQYRGERRVVDIPHTYAPPQRPQLMGPPQFIPRGGQQQQRGYPQQIGPSSSTPPARSPRDIQIAGAASPGPQQVPRAQSCPPSGYSFPPHTHPQQVSGAQSFSPGGYPISPYTPSDPPQQVSGVQSFPSGSYLVSPYTPSDPPQQVPGAQSSSPGGYPFPLRTLSLHLQHSSNIPAPGPQGVSQEEANPPGYTQQMEEDGETHPLPPTATTLPPAIDKEWEAKMQAWTNFGWKIYNYYDENGEDAQPPMHFKCER